MKPYGALERAFAASGLMAVLGSVGGAWLNAHNYGWPALLALASFLLLLSAMVGMRAQGLVVQFQRGELALVYATALQGPRRRVFNRRDQPPTWSEALGLTFGELIDTIRVSVLGSDRLKRWAMDVRQALSDRRPAAQRLAATLGEDAHVIAAALNASRRAEADIVTECGVLSQHANEAIGQTSAMAEDVRALADAVRQVSAHAEHATAEAGKLADTAFAAQRNVVAVADVTASLIAAADQVKAVLQRADMLGINAGIEAARAGDAGRGFAVVAAEIKALATSGQTALESMLHIVAGLKVESAGMRQTVTIMGDTVHAQTEVGRAMADAASYQLQAIGRVVRQMETANAQILSMRDRTHSFQQKNFGLAGSSAARTAVERLPVHAEAVAAILRDLPQFVDDEK